MRDELLKLKSERLAKESHISRLELAVSENVDQINELQSRLRLVNEVFFLNFVSDCDQYSTNFVTTRLPSGLIAK